MKKSLSLVVAVAIAGCATYQPIVDTRGMDSGRYQFDLGECQRLAAQVDPAANAAGNAVAGAVVGAILGSLIGGNRRGAGTGAGLGAVAGGVGGGAHSAAVQQDIFRRCMMGRGYNVLY